MTPPPSIRAGEWCCESTAPPVPYLPCVPRPVVALTGYGQEGDRRRPHDAGFDRHMVKSVDPTALTDLMASLDTPGREESRPGLSPARLREKPGCGVPKRVAVAPAEVKVHFKGHPAAGARIVLVPGGDDSPDGIKPRGRPADGTVKFGTYALADGAPLGEHRVSVRCTAKVRSQNEVGEDAPPGPPGGVQPDYLGERYSDSKTSRQPVKPRPAIQSRPSN